MWTNSENLIKGIVAHSPDIIKYYNASDLQQYVNRVVEERLPYPLPTSLPYGDWFIPDSYKSFDIEEYCYSMCNTEEEVLRVELEYQLFVKHGLIPVLQAMKYIVDTLRDNAIVWGVGRGSSVASYVLFLIGIHKVNSIKYNLDIYEFIR